MSSGFISESEILEARRRRQEEWEKVRTEDQPKENMIRGLDDDEVGFLDLVERSKAKAAQQISIEEQREMQEFRERVSNLAESEELTRLRAQLAPARNTQASSQITQKNKLQGVVVRKRKASDLDDKQDKDAPPTKTNGVVTKVNSPQQKTNSADSKQNGGTMNCVGVLPGLGQYDTDSTSDTDRSSDESDASDKCCRRDLLGRRPEAKSKEDKS